MGQTSARFSNQEVVLKIMAQKDASQPVGYGRREACILRHLNGTTAPALLGVDDRGEILLMSNVGEPLSVANLPVDARVQVESILEEMDSRGVAHTDAWKNMPNFPSVLSVELLVDAAGRLHLIDFNAARLNGSLACEEGMPELKGLPWHTPADDRVLLRLVDALVMLNQTIRSYGNLLDTETRVRHGICALKRLVKPPSMPNVTAVGRYLQHAATSRPRLADGNASECEDPSWLAGEFPMPAQTRPGANDGITDFMGSAPLFYNPLPSRRDVRACLKRCKQCSRCAHVSVSSHRQVCLWFAPGELAPMHDVTCKEVAPGGFLQSRTSGHGLDDFLTFSLALSRVGE